MDHTLSIDEEITRQCRRFNATGSQHTLRLLPPSDSIHDDGTENQYVNSEAQT
jgi:hypothetical protein